MDAAGKPARDLPFVCWSESRAVDWPEARAGAELLPRVTVERWAPATDGWEPAQGAFGRVDSHTPDLVVVLVDAGARRWCAHWATAALASAADAFRFHIARASGDALCSQPFTSAAPPAGSGDCAKGGVAIANGREQRRMGR